MSFFLKPAGIFDLENSDCSVGSYFKKEDLKKIFNASDDDFKDLNFEKDEFQNEIIDEFQIHLNFKKINQKLILKNSSFDEYLLSAIIKKVFPESIVEQQIHIKRFKMDLKVQKGDKILFIEFHGPSHFVYSKFGLPNDPFRKKHIIEKETDVEVVIWPYWVQKCETNVKCLFHDNVKGFGCLWNCNVHFGDFCFENSAQIIETISQRFNVYRNGYGYFYEGNSFGRKNLEHPIISKIIKGKEKIDRLIPRGFNNKDIWIPEKLKG